MTKILAVVVIQKGNIGVKVSLAKSNEDHMKSCIYFLFVNKRKYFITQLLQITYSNRDKRLKGANITAEKLKTNKEAVSRKIES